MKHRPTPGPLIYVAGPYTSPDPVENTHLAYKEADLISQMGGVPFVPHSSLTWHLISPKPYSFWLSYDMAVLLRCDGLYRMPGESPGADDEEELANDHSIPVLTTRGATEHFIDLYMHRLGGVI